MSGGTGHHTASACDIGIGRSGRAPWDRKSEVKGGVVVQEARALWLVGKVAGGGVRASEALARSECVSRSKRAPGLTGSSGGGSVLRWL